MRFSKNPARSKKSKLKRVLSVVKGKPNSPYFLLLNKYLRKPVTMENMWKLEQELQRREKANPSKKRAANATRKKYIARYMFNKKDAKFLLILCELKQENKDAFIKTEIQKISKQENITKLGAAKVLLEYAQKLKKTINEKSNTLAKASWSLKSLAVEPEKSAVVRHEFIGSIPISFFMVISGFVKRLEKYQWL